ncbi:MAG: redoxin domain-containing protein [Alistipes sp.]|nr:redoxin domain-containing protein [Alistipes sp.]
MNKLSLILLSATAALMCSCQPAQVTIDGRLVAGDEKTVYLEQVSSLRQQVIDTATLDNEGNYRFEVEQVAKTPSLYNILYNGERIPLFLSAGDHLKVNSVGNIVRNYTVEGSTESELLRSFYQSFIAGAQNLESIAKRVSNQTLPAEEREALLKEYTDQYYAIRREQLRFIAENKASLAAVYAIYQRLPGDQYLSDGVNDVIHYRSVAEALAANYPESPYLVMLRGDITRMEAAQRLVEEMTESTFPDLELSDIYGKKVRLSSLLGKVILLDFWSAELGNSNVMNAELKEIYAKYHNAATPFEVYQVAVDTSKPLWISTVQEQQLPWISVSDLRGRASTALGTYNVTKLPTSFLIDKEGTIVGRDIRGEELERKLQQLTR